MNPVNNGLFGSDLWKPALEKYAEATHVTVKLFDADERVVLGPIHQTPLFQLFDEKGYDPGLFVECARRCLAQTENRPAVMVSQIQGLAVIGTSLVLDDKIVGAAVAGYVFVDFSQVSEIQRIAHEAGIGFERLWQVAREQKPVPQGRLIIHGELLQVLGDALLRENSRTRQYQETASQLEEAARAKARLAAIVEFSEDAIISKDLNGTILTWNRGAERLFGYTAQEAIGQPITILMPADQPNEEPEILNRIRRGESIEHYETVRCRKDGAVLNISLTISPIIDEKGKIVGASKIARDISDRKRAEEALRQSHDHLERIVEQRTASLRELSANLMRSQDDERRKISRELHDSTGQDLTGLKLDLSAIGREVEKIKPDLAERIAQNAEFAGRIADNLRTMSYLLHPPMLDELGLRSAVNWFVEGFSKRSGIRVNLDMPDELRRLPDALELVLFRILQESLTNIHRHSQSRSVDVRLKLGASEITLQVRDYGEGMPADLLGRFQTKGTGVGVGLRSMQERVSEMGGGFEIQSEKKGTLIRATIPLSHTVLKSHAVLGRASGA